MKTVTMLKGLPASGKSSWAKEQVLKHAGQYIRINKDDMRAMYHANHFSKGNEAFTLKMRNVAMLKALESGKHVIIDDTNFLPKHEYDIRALVKDFADVNNQEIKVEVKFFDVPLQECIERDKKRENSVGHKVISGMYNKYLRVMPEEIEYIDGAEDAVICDLDGTLAIHQGRSAFDASRCEEDKLNTHLETILNGYLGHGNELIFLTGREDLYREQTQRWLDSHGFTSHDLFMRKTGDFRKDYVIKQEIYEAEIKDKYNVLAVFDDRLQVRRMWHSLGLPLFSVGDPDADF